MGEEEEQRAERREPVETPISPAHDPMTPRPYDPASQMRSISRRSFVWAGLYVAGTYGALRWINSRPDAGGVGLPFRKGLGFNESVWRKAFSPDRLVPTYDPSQITEERVNGDDGLSDGYDLD